MVNVTCAICKRDFCNITNTHLKLHGYTVDRYRKDFPNNPIMSKEFIIRQSNILKGKNLGNKRPDAKKYMSKNNPMKNRETVRKMSKTRRKEIAKGNINPINNFNHLPTPYEKKLIKWFEKWNIPLKYVGDGRLNIEGCFPDFINEDKKIILELELNFCKRPIQELSKKEKVYTKAGYKTIWITKFKKKYIKKWVRFYFRDCKVKSLKINRIWHEEPTGRQNVYNFEVQPNNTYVANGIVVHNCFANSFRASLYTAFFDNSKTMGLRHCNPDKYKKELDKLMKYRGKNPLEINNSLGKAIAMNLPIRFGIRFEDFLKREEKLGVSLELLKYLQEQNYPLMINTKSDLVAKDAYLRVLEKGNPGRTAVHVTLISNNNQILKKLEPAAPSYESRIQAMKVLVRHDVRVVARIEPWIPFVNDGEEETLKYMNDLENIGVQHVTFDTYSYTAKNQGIAQSFKNEGYDWDRINLLGCDSQGLSSLLLGKFMEMWREKGFSCSTFDMGNMSSNNQSICCEVGDWFQDSTFNHGCTVMAAQFIIKRKGHKTTWSQYKDWVNKHGGFLSDALEKEVHQLWNCEGNDAYSSSWAKGIEVGGMDEEGNIIWKYEKENDFREDILEGLLK